MKKYCVTVWAIVCMVIFFNTGKVFAVSDTGQNLCLWRMDSIDESGTILDKYSHSRAAVRDTDVFYAGTRQNHLILGQVRSTEDLTQRPTLALRSGNDYAMNFDGINDMAYSAKAWNNTQDFEVEFDAYPLNNATTPTFLVSVVNSWSIIANIGSGNVSFSARVMDGGVLKAVTSAAFALDNWYHIKACFQDGVANIEVNGTASADLAYSVIDPAFSTLPEVYVGASQYAARSFLGMIDNVSIKDLTIVPAEYMSTYEDNLMTKVLFHFDELGTSGPVQTFDDNSSGRLNRNGTIVPLNYPPDEYTWPILVPSFDADQSDPNILGPFGKCLYFDGINHAVRLGSSTTDDLGIPNTNVRIEMWAKLDMPVKNNNNAIYHLFYQADRFNIMYTDRTQGDWRLDFRVWTSGGLKTVAVVIADPTKWNHYAIEFNNGKLEGFFNGVSMGKLENIGLLSSAVRHFMISGDQNNIRRWKGWIDEFRVSLLTGTCGDLGYSPADFNKDCYVDDEDLIMFAAQWLTDTIN